MELVVSDAHQGLRDAIATVFGGASWQRCRTHFMTNLLTRVPRSAQPWVATMVRTIYQQPSPQEVHAQLDRVIAQLKDPFPQVASLLDEVEARRPGLLQFPCRPLEGDLVQQPLGAPRQRDPAAHRCGGYLPQPASRAPPGWGRPSRAARRMGRRPSIHDTRFSHLQRSSNGSRTRGGSGLDYINRMTYSYTSLQDVTYFSSRGRALAQASGSPIPCAPHDIHR